MITTVWNNIKSNKQFYIQIILTGILFSIPAFYNRYPLFFSDSGTYMVSLFEEKMVPMDRAFGYGFLMRIISQQLSLWPVILFQNVVASVLIWKVLSRFFNGHIITVTHMLVCIFLLTGSSLPWYSNQIMPDIITSFMILVLYLFFTSVSKYKFAYLAVLLVFLITHFSHFPILLFSATTIAGLQYFFRMHTLKNLMYKTAAVYVIVALGVVVIAAQSYKNEQGFVFSHSSNVFISGRLSETGLLKKYLQKNCNTIQSPLCEYADSLSPSAADFLWNDNSAINKVARKHFQQQSNAHPTSEEKWHYLNNDLLKPVVRDLFTTPKYLVQFMYYGFRESVVQFFQINIGSGLSSYGVNSPPYWPILVHLPTELSSFLTSVQNSGTLHFDTINLINYVVLLASFLLIWYAWITGKLSAEIKVLCVFIVVCMYWNAFFTAALANVYDRLQARVTWLFVLTALIAAVSMYTEYRKQVGDKKSE